MGDVAVGRGVRRPVVLTGMPLTLLGIERIARIWGRGQFSTRPNGRLTTKSLSPKPTRPRGSSPGATQHSALRYVHDVLDVLFRRRGFSELARRVAAAGAAATVLCADHPTFGGRDEALLNPCDIGGDRTPTRVTSAAAVECMNIAGLCDPAKRNWYPVDLDDAVRGAAKLGVAPGEVRDAIARAMLI